LIARTLGFAVAVASAAAAAQTLVPYRVDGDEIRAPLTRAPADAGRGRAIVIGRDSSCVLCHVVPEPAERAMGNVGPPLAGVGARFSAGQLRLRIVDSTRINPATPMPPYYRVDDLQQVAAAYRGKPILTAQEVEDVVAYLQTLR